jgi:RNA polymerase sigma-70 factor, ECF subfamily
VGGDPAFEALFEREYAPLVTTAYFILRDEGLAQEVVQEAFARALSRWRRVSGYDRPGAWLRLVTVRLALRVRDSRAREGVGRDDSDVERSSSDRLPDVDLRRAVLALPRAQRAVVALHYLDDLTTEEVAHILKMKPATVRVHLHRARKYLAALIGEEIPDAT